MQDVAAHGSDNRVDAEIFLGALYRRENQTRRAVPIVEDLIRRFPRNYLLRLELSQMYSMAGDKTDALAAVEKVVELKTRHAPGYDRVPWEKIYYQQGTIEFWYGELDHALGHLQQVAAAPEIDLNTGVYTYLRIGQIYDLQQRRAQALEAYRKAIAYAPEADGSPRGQEVPRDALPAPRKLGGRPAMVRRFQPSPAARSAWRPCPSSAPSRVSRPLGALAGILNLMVVSVCSSISQTMSFLPSVR